MANACTVEKNKRFQNNFERNKEIKRLERHITKTEKEIIKSL